MCIVASLLSKKIHMIDNIISFCERSCIVFIYFRPETNAKFRVPNSLIGKPSKYLNSLNTPFEILQWPMHGKKFK